MTTDLELMKIALEEAKKCSRAVRPNPKVGAALLSKDGRVVADHHKKVGEPHAEREVLNRCEEMGIKTQGATMAVTLEPCSHHGRTPPCADAIIEAGVARVLVGVRDPFEKVQGSGLEKLRAAGVKVIEGVLEKECEELNKYWLFAQRKRRPFVQVKMATSLDGLWTAESGDSRWITGDAARHLAHDFRREVDAIITGRGTVEKDNPAMTARNSDGSLSEAQPRVIVFSARPDFDLNRWSIAKHPAGAEVVNPESLAEFLKDLYNRGVHHALVEAGPKLTHSLMQGGMGDEILLFQSCSILGGEGQRIKSFNFGRLPGLLLKRLEHRFFENGDNFQRLIRL